MVERSDLGWSSGTLETEIRSDVNTLRYVTMSLLLSNDSGAIDHVPEWN